MWETDLMLSRGVEPGVHPPQRPAFVTCMARTSQEGPPCGRAERRCWARRGGEKGRRPDPGRSAHSRLEGRGCGVIGAEEGGERRLWGPADEAVEFSGSVSGTSLHSPLLTTEKDGLKGETWLGEPFTGEKQLASCRTE